MMQNAPTAPLRTALAACLIFASCAEIPSLWAQSPNGASPSATYADIADLATTSPIVARVQILKATPLGKAQQVGVPQGYKRFYVEARVAGLIRGDNGISPEISYLFDAPLDSRGKPPKLKKKEALVFARPGGRPGQIQLVARDAQMDFVPTTEATAKSVVSELLGKSPPPIITGIGDAFHVAGTIAGEGETQIFLKTQNGDPVSLSIIRRPGEDPTWAVALGEVVDEAAATPKPGTLLWYRLACALPSSLPDRSVRTLGPIDADSAKKDYALVLQGLGRCNRTRTAP